MKLIKKYLKKFFSLFKLDKKKIIKKVTNILLGLLFLLRWFIILIVWTFYIILILACFLIPYAILIVPVIYMIIKLVIKLGHFKFLNAIRANTIVHGGRGKGKSLLFQYVVLKEGACLSNIEWGYDSVIVEPKTYFESLAPNTTIDMIEGTNKIVKKNDFFEGKPYLLDDVSVYFPNYNDNLLKKLYPSMSLLIPVQRHAYNSFTIINVQAIERSYKILRELQMDGYIKALKVIGFGYIWSRLPIVRKYTRTSYRYHENLESALNNKLPFDKMGLVNKTSQPLFTTPASALQEVYKGENGIIFDGSVWLKKKHIKYDTRFYHRVLFGKKAPPQ